MPPAVVRPVSTSRAVLGENPLWDPRTERLYSVDAMGRKLFLHEPAAGTQQEWALPLAPGAFALRSKGGLLMAFRRGLALIEPGAAEPGDMLTPFFNPEAEIFNDGKCDRRGRFWVGTMHRKASDPVGGLYRVDHDLTVTRMADQMILSNGIAWSPDDRILYHCDTRAALIWAYDYDIAEGAIANRRVFADFRHRKGRPDGCTTDTEGGLWVAEVEAGQVIRFDPTGQVTRTVPVPVTHPTSVIFGGPGLKTLFITSMQFGIPPEELAHQPLAGAVFAADVGAQGLPEVPFAG